jgi:3-dehydroquinate synthase
MTNQPEQPQPSLPPHRKVHVDLGPRAYDVVIGRGLLQSFRGFLTEARVTVDPILIADVRIPKEYELELRKQLEPGYRDEEFVQGAMYHASEKEGEHEDSKSLKNYAALMSKFAQEKVSRQGVAIALGGGVIGDMVGFVAATYLRGINFVQVPTTLLAMVDSSVGGKTGVNLPEGKNLVGAFHQPKLVVADLDTLATLPPREFAAGMAEVIKYGAIRDKALFERVIKGVKPGDADLDVIVETCVAIKARIVENDEFETKGERALLNFGHTIGHAIEKATGYKKYLHGEAISLGMRAAAWLSRREAGLSQEDARDLDVALIANQLPVVLDREVDSQAILAALGNDKKVAADGVNRWVLLTEMGKAESGRIISPELVAQAVEYLRTHPDDL